MADLRNVFEHGQVVEDYPAERRALLYASAGINQMPVHIVIEEGENEGVIVTAYIPDPSLWIGSMRRRLRG